jgi:hypothetical protein
MSKKMDTPGNMSENERRRKRSDSTSPVDLILVSQRRMGKPRRKKTKMASSTNPVKDHKSTESIDETLESVASGFDDHENEDSQNVDSSADESFAYPSKEPKWLSKVLSKVSKDFHVTCKKEMSIQMNRGLKSLKTELKADVRRVEDNLRLEDQLAAASTSVAAPAHLAPPRTDRINLPNVCAITIDGIHEGESDCDELLLRCQRGCFRHMGFNYSPIQVAECFRVGRPNESEGRPPPHARPRSVYVLFNDVCYRESVLKRRFELRNRRVFVNEYHPWEVEQDRLRQYPI